MKKLAITGGEPLRKEPFTKWPIYGNEELFSVKEVFESGLWGIGGSKVEKFQNEFAKLHGSKYGIALMNGTVALEVSLKACRIGEGDEVIVPDYTFSATATSVLSVNATPVFVDIDFDTFCIDPQKIIEAITPKTKAIIVVHLGGQPADMDAIQKIASQHEIYVIEDAAQAHFAEWDSKKVGSLGHIACFSFQSSKNITSGEGGIIITNDKELADRAWSYHNSGRKRGGKWYEHPYLGNNFRMTEFQAAILLAQLKRADEQIKKRVENAEYLKQLLKGIEGITTLKLDNRTTLHSYHLFIIKYHKEFFSEVTRDTFVEALNSEGIPATRGYVPLHKEGFLNEAKEFTLKSKIYSERNYRKLNFPCTERACELSIWLPQYILLGNIEDMDDIAEAFKKVTNYIYELVSNNNFYFKP